MARLATYWVWLPSAEWANKAGNLSQEIAVRTDGLGWYANYITDASGRRLRAFGPKDYTEEYRYDALGRIVFQRLNEKWRVHSYNLSGDSRVIASSDDEKAAKAKSSPPRKKK